MSIRHCLVGPVYLMLLSGSFGCTMSGSDDRARLMKEVDTTLTYPMVAEDISKHVGKRVAWHGLQIGGDPTKEIEHYTYMPTAKNSGVDFEKPFMFNRSDGKDMRNDAQKKVNDKHRQLIIGTISGSGEFKYQTGNVKKQITAPVLTDVSILGPEK